MIIYEDKYFNDSYYTDIVNSIINIIKIKGINKVSIFIDRSPLLLVIIYELFKNDIAFIPIDTKLPHKRINDILSDNEGLVITQKCYKNLINEYDTIFIDDIPNILDIRNEIWNSSELAYILYTSGSTGKPKGVEVTREALINFIDGISEIIDFSPNKKIACFTTVSFDIFFLESIVALYKGVTVVLANEEEQHNPKLMSGLIINNDVDMIQMTPSRMLLLYNYDNELVCLKNVKEIMIGGEPFPLNLLKILQSKTNAKIYNMYGPTETTIWSTVSDLTNSNSVTLGNPIKNTQIFIVDENSNIIENGQIGEICISGKGLAKGYYKQEALTSEKFVYLPQYPNVMVYKTGDLGRFLDNGELCFIGRIDNQVKIRGYRIELEEIEFYINQYNGISQSAVKVVNINETNKILEVVYTANADINIDELKYYLSENLPDYMIPSKFTRISEFSYTINGKIDRKELNILTEFSKEEKCHTILSEIQQEIINIIKQNLNNSLDIKLDMNLSDLGIDSVMFVKIIVEIESVFNFEFDDEKLLFTAFPQIIDLIDYVSDKVK